uniref:Small-subunit processome Utp21 domain-containing protein n=1 Tax=Panagrolaimus superbus TaxID=310955 RepID=A0A914Y3L1_9BILA
MYQQPTTLFTPYKSLGLVCSSIPPTFQSKPKEKRLGDVNAAIGNVFVTYRMQPFRRYKVSDPTPKPITVLEKDKAHVFAAYDNIVCVFKNNQTLVRQIEVEKNVKFMLSFVDILAVIDVENTIRIIDVNDCTQILEIPSPPSFEATCVVHPLTYMNKIVLGGSNGEMRLINIKTGKLVHEFPPKPLFDSSITCIVQSTVVDIVAIGHANGKIQLRNLKTDEKLCSFKQDGSITAISFRTDAIESMATANSEGSIALWDLNEQILIGQRSNVHSGPITSLYFIKGMPYLISAGVDNRMIKWSVEEEQSLPTINTELAGHSAPVSSIAFFGENAIVSASLDGYVRGYNIIRDDIMKSLGKAREVKKTEVSRDRFMDVPLEPIVEMDVGMAREGAWDNVICRHKNSPIVSTWSSRRQTKGEKLLYHERFAKNPDYITAYSTSISISACGNFAFIGYSTGHVDMFNLQSGFFRGTFAMKSEVKQSTNKMIESERANDDYRAHPHPVNAIVSDISTQKLITGASDGLIRFWTIKPTKCFMQCQLPAGVLKFKLDRLNSLLAVAAESGALVIVDALSGKIVRKFLKAHAGSFITALEYSRDGKWIVSADDEGKIKIWDIATSLLIDCMLCPSACVSLAFNPGGQFLTTAHKGEKAVYVWANIPMFVDDIDLQASDEDSTRFNKVNLPGLTAVDISKRVFDDDEIDNEYQVIIDSDAEDLEEMQIEIQNEELINYDQSSDLFSFSGLPPARWANLSELEAIKTRNKPVEPPKKPKHAPFFLPTIENLEGVSFDKMDLTDSSERERIIAAKRKLLEFETPFATKLKEVRFPEQYLEIFEELKTMSLSSIDFQIRSLPSSAIVPFLNVLIMAFGSRFNLDLVQSYLITFLRIHRDNLWSLGGEDVDAEEVKSISDTLEIIKKIVRESVQSLKLDINQNMAVLQWIKAAVVQIC